MRWELQARRPFELENNGKVKAILIWKEIILFDRIVTRNHGLSNDARRMSVGPRRSRGKIQTKLNPDSFYLYTLHTRKCGTMKLEKKMVQYNDRW